MRNAEGGMSGGASCSGSTFPFNSAFRIPHSTFVSFIPHSAFLFLAQRQQVRKQPIRTGHASRQLSEEAQPGVHVRALAERRHEQAAREWRAAPTLHLHQRRIGRIPLAREEEPPPLHPAPPPVPTHLV